MGSNLSHVFIQLGKRIMNSTIAKTDLKELKIDLIKWMVGLSFTQLALLMVILIKVF